MRRLCVSLSMVWVGCAWMTNVTDPVNSMDAGQDITVEWANDQRLFTDDRATLALTPESTGGTEVRVRRYRKVDVSAIEDGPGWLDVTTPDGLILRFSGPVGGTNIHGTSNPGDRDAYVAPWVLIMVQGVPYETGAVVTLDRVNYHIERAPKLRLMFGHKVPFCCD
jgi:hypothetical protein